MLEKLLQTEITMLRAIRDGSALMQHMEDFYYIALLEVRFKSTETSMTKQLCTLISLKRPDRINRNFLSLLCGSNLPRLQAHGYPAPLQLTVKSLNILLVALSYFGDLNLNFDLHLKN